MNNPNPFVPKGSLLDQQSQRRSRLKIAVFCVLAVSVSGLVAMLIQGCKREAPATDQTPPPLLTDTNLPAPESTNPPAVDTNPPVPVPTQPVQQQQPQAAIPVPIVPPTQPQVTAPMEPAGGATYEVVAGDTLGKIAKAHGVTVKALEAANPGVDPKKLKVKQKLVIPGATQSADTTSAAPTAAVTSAGSETYVVKSGDTLSKIAKKSGVSVRALRAANPKIASTDHIKVGDKLTIPGKAETAAPAPATDTTAAPVVPPPAPATSSAPIAPAPTPAPGH
jgi:LysM repeat protein